MVCLRQIGRAGRADQSGSRMAINIPNRDEKRGLRPRARNIQVNQQSPIAILPCKIKFMICVACRIVSRR